MTVSKCSWVVPIVPLPKEQVTRTASPDIYFNCQDRILLSTFKDVYIASQIPARQNA